MKVSDMFRPAPKLSIGQRFKNKSSFDEYLLACTGPCQAGLVNIRSGSRWGPLTCSFVKDLRNITEAEAKKIFCQDQFNITLDMWELTHDPN